MEVKIPIRHTKEFGIYYWDTFDNTIILINEFDTIEEATGFVTKQYEDRLGNHGADQINIVNKDGDIVEKFAIG